MDLLKNSLLNPQSESVYTSINLTDFFIAHQLFFLGMIALFSLLGYLLHQRYKFLSLPIKKFSLLIVSFEIILTAIIFLEFTHISELEHTSAKSNQTLYSSHTLLNNWHNINTTLSEYAKSHITTNKPQFKHDYLHILSIQKGTQPRPFFYSANYWRLDTQLRDKYYPDNKQESLQQRINTQSFSPDEQTLIQHILATSKEQREIEQQAFSLFANNQKQQAINLLYSLKYTATTATNALHFTQLLASIYTKNQVHHNAINHQIEQKLLLLISLMILFIIGNLSIHSIFTKKMAQPIAYITKAIKEFNNGLAVSNSAHFFTDEIAEMMTHFFIMQEKILSQQQTLADFNEGLSKQIEAKTRYLNEQKQELEVLLSAFNKNVIFSRTDLQGVITQASEAFCKISGYTEAELLGKTHHIISHPDMPAETFEMLWNALQQQQDITLELKNKHKNGHAYWVNSHFQADYNSHKQLVGYSATRHDITAQKELEYLSNNLQLKIEQAKQELAAAHQQTRDSIKYASLIQGALIADNELFRDYFSDYFVIWHPKDIVGGDIYFFEPLRHQDECLLMVIDCTGHGVPGAFVSMLIKAVERQIVAKIMSGNEPVSPAELLKTFNRSLKKLLKQESSLSLSNVGFDGSILYYNKQDKLIKFAAANTALVTVKDAEISKIKGSRHSVGYKKSDANFEFTEHRIATEAGMQFYLLTDGYIDQNGGEKGFCFGQKRFQALIQEYAQETMADQQEVLLYELSHYQGEYERNDDITVVGFKI